MGLLAEAMREGDHIKLDQAIDVIHFLVAKSIFVRSKRTKIFPANIIIQCKFFERIRSAPKLFYAKTVLHVNLLDEKKRITVDCLRLQ